MNEGNILVLGDTENRDHGVILVVGREPNNDLDKAVRIDKYGKDWRASGKGRSCQYWDMAYTLSGRIIGLGRRELKAKCVNSESSPIAFADLSPLSLDGKYSPAKKIELRKQISKSEYEDHLKSVFSHKKFLKRVNLVICAGHKGVGLTAGYPLLEKLCNESNIEFCHIASLNSTKHTIDHRLQQMGSKKKILANTFNSYFHPHNYESQKRAA